ncbi:hypothetical protein J6590_016741 [Homalodisca vitripennis]|nr:hypothetical protein J6590_016741 [Homalodisca vitripennis]
MLKRGVVEGVAGGGGACRVITPPTVDPAPITSVEETEPLREPRPAGEAATPGSRRPSVAGLLSQLLSDAGNPC